MSEITNSEEYNKLITQFKMLRNAKLMSSDELAKASGISRSTISRFENGKCSISLDKLVKMLEVLNGTINISSN